MKPMFRALGLVALIAIVSLSAEHGIEMARAAFWQWSQTATANGTADPTINWAEGMPPSVVNDSARAMMARLVEQANDTSGALLTTGGPTAFSVTTNQGFPNPPNNGMVIGVTFNVAPSAGATLSVDGGTAEPIPLNLTSGVPYTLLYSSATTSWLVRTTGGSTVIRGYISGLTLSTSGPSSTFGVSPGIATDSTYAAMMTLSTSLSKTTSAWVAGNGGALDTGTIANSTWYHVFLIENVTTRSVDIVISATATPASGPTVMPTGYTLYRRIGSVKTGAVGTWVVFSQFGNEFLWSVPVADITTTTLGTTATLFSLSYVPPGVQVRARLRATFSNAGSQVGITVTSPDEAVQAVNTPLGNNTANTSAAAVGAAMGEVTTRTNTSAQIRVVAGVNSTSLNAVTSGWYDTRGQDQ